MGFRCAQIFQHKEHNDTKARRKYDFRQSSTIDSTGPYTYMALRAFFVPLREIKTGKNRSKPVKTGHIDPLRPGVLG